MNPLKILQFFDDNTYNEKFIKDFVIKVKEDFIKKELKKFKTRKVDVVDVVTTEPEEEAKPPSKKKTAIEQYMSNRDQDRCSKCDRRDAACYCT